MKELKHKFNSNGTLALQMMLLLRQGSLITVALLMSKCFSIPEIGILESLQFLLTTFSFFWINGLIQWFLPAYQNTPQAERDAFLWRIFSFFCVLSLVLFCFFMPGKTFIFSFFLQKSPFEESTLFFVYALLFVPTYLLEYFLFVQKKYYKILFFSLLQFFIQNIAILLAWYFHWGINGILWIWIFGAVLRLIFIPTPPLPKGEGVVRFSLPFGAGRGGASSGAALSLIAYSFMAQWAVTFDGWLVNYYYGGATLFFAIFRYGAREFPLVMALSTGLSASASAAISQNYEEGVLMLRKKTTRLLHGLFPFTLLLLLSSSYWFPIIFSKSFEASIIVFDIFLLLIISRLLFPQAIALAINENKTMFYISLIELLINIATSSILVHFWGLAGIAAGTWLASFSEKILIAIYLHHKHRIPFDSYTPSLIWFAYSAILVLAYVLKYAI